MADVRTLTAKYEEALAAERQREAAVVQHASALARSFEQRCVPTPSASTGVTTPPPSRTSSAVSSPSTTLVDVAHKQRANGKVREILERLERAVLLETATGGPATPLPTPPPSPLPSRSTPLRKPASAAAYDPAHDPASRSSTLTSASSASQPALGAVSHRLLAAGLSSPVCLSPSTRAHSHAARMASVRTTSSSRDSFESFEDDHTLPREASVLTKEREEQSCSHVGADGPADRSKEELITPRAALPKKLSSQFPSPPPIADIPVINESFSQYSISGESLEQIQILEDIDDDDLDNIDGVEHVDDFDSQDGRRNNGDDNSESDANTVRRADTVEDLGIDDDLFGSTDPPRGIGPVESTDEFDAIELEIAQSRSTVPRRASSRRPRPQSAPVTPAPLEPSRPSAATDEQQPALRAYREENRNSGSKRDSSSGANQSRDRCVVSSSSLKRLPKAKVMIGRKRGQSVNLEYRQRSDPAADDDSGLMPLSSPAALDIQRPETPNARRLVKEYSNPKELLAGPISMLEVLADDEEPVPIVSRPPAPHHSSRNAQTAITPFNHRQARKDMFKKRYDEYLDAEEIGTRKNGKAMADSIPVVSSFPITSNSKEKYRNKKKLFGSRRASNIDKEKQRAERHERHLETIKRRSTMVSGALDRVSMAADPWIDFITDANTMPGTTKARGPFRRAMKKLFGRGKQELIKN